MTIEITVPEVGESVREVLIGRWLKSEGDSVAQDEDVVELDTDKASMELPAPAAGVLREIRVSEGETAAIGDVIAVLEQTEDEKVRSKKEKHKSKNGRPKPKDKKDKAKEPESGTPQSTATEDAHQTKKRRQEEDAPARTADTGKHVSDSPHVTPSARRELRKHGVSPEDIVPAGKRIRASDVRRHLEQRDDHEQAAAAEHRTAAERREPRPQEDRLEEVVPMSHLRKLIATRLVEAQQQAALLTTLNEIDLSQVIALRNSSGERFKSQYGVKLGFMSFFVKGIVDALRQHPVLNAEVRQESIVYRNYYHVGIAIGSERGLVVPVLRNAERMSFAEIEQAIDDFASRADSGELTPDELHGGTFTISNGGIYGSLLSTPLVNPPQTGVLGMHAIEDRPVVRNGEIVIRPMMYVALTYDHRIVDGREAVTFLRRLKQTIEEPARMLIEA